MYIVKNYNKTYKKIERRIENGSKFTKGTKS